METKSVWLEDIPYLLHAELKPVGDGSVTDLVCRWYSFNASSAKFDFTAKKCISHAMNFMDTNIYGCRRTILDSGIGSRRPYFCLTSKKKKGEATFSFVTLHSTSVADDTLEDFKIMTLANASCDSQISDEFEFLDGPLLTWKGERYIYFLLRIPGGKFNLAQVRMKKMVKDYVSDPGTVEFLRVCASKSTSCLVLFVCRTEAKFLFFEVDCLDAKVIVQDSPVPDRYAMSVKAVELYNGEKSRICALVVNRENEMIVVDGSEVKTKVKFDGTPNFLFMQKHLVVSCGTEVKIFSRDGFSLVSKFARYSSVIGDFTSRGPDQLLLLAEKPTSQNSITKFILTDFSMIYYDTSEECADTISPEVNASMQTFCSAVQGRLRASLQWLVRAKNERERKLDHIRQSCENINKMAVDGDTKDTKIPLVPFLNNNNYDTGEPEPPKGGTQNPYTVLRTWQLILLGRLCIGVDIQCLEDIDVKDMDAITMGLVPSQEFTNSYTTSGVVRKENDVRTIVCVTDPPPMVRSELTCDLVLNLVRGQGLSRSAMCGKVVLTSSRIRELMDTELSLDMREERVLDSLSVIQQTVNLSIQSGQLLEEDDVFSLFQRVGFLSNQEKSNSRHGDSWLYHKLTGALGAVRVRLLSWIRGKSIFEVHYKDKSQVLCLVHSLYDLLDDDAKILRFHGDETVAMDITDSMPETEEVMYDSDVMIFDEA